MLKGAALSYYEYSLIYSIDMNMMKMEIRWPTP